MKKFLFTFALLSFTVQAAPLNVLTYTSLLDKGGLGEEILAQAKAQKIEINFSTSKDFAGILGTLRRLKREKKLSTVDVVLGLNAAHYQSALSEGLVQPGQAFEAATFSLLVNKEMLPEKNWPKDWAEVKEKLAGKILIQDPRTSEVGLTWLLNDNLKLAEQKKLPKKIFPNWSSSFEAFEAKLAPVLWTYSTSAAYFACASDDKSQSKAKQYANLPLPNYPKDQNFIALVKDAKAPNAEKLKALVLSAEVQNQIWQKNWMLPATYPAQIKEMPKCFTQVWFPKDAKDVEALSGAELLKRLDQWSL